MRKRWYQKARMLVRIKTSRELKEEEILAQ
jgi:hypothetical protein